MKTNSFSFDSTVNILDYINVKVCWKDTKGFYLGCNSSFSKFVGLSDPEEIIGKTENEMPWSKQAKIIKKNDNYIIKTGMTSLVEEKRVLSQDKSINFLVERVPIKDPANKVLGIVATLSEMDSSLAQQTPHRDKKESENENQRKIDFYTRIAKQEKIEIENKSQLESYVSYVYDYLEKIIACMPGNVYWLDKNSVFLGCNNNVAKMLGLRSRTDIIGMTHAETAKLGHWSEGQAESFERDDKAVIATGIPKINVEEPPITDVTGKKIQFLSSRVPLYDSDHNVMGVVGISIDISERKKLEQDLLLAKNAAEAANQAKTQFIANMSHDIRTPLSGIVGMSELLEDEVHDAKQKQYAEWINQCGEQLLGLLNGILDVVSADNISENDLREETFDLRHCLNDLVQLERPSTLLKGLDLRLEVEPQVPRYIVSDRTKIHRTLLNLLGNAIKFTEKGSVSIIVKLIQQNAEQAQLQFRVSDTGIGIPQDLQDKVFDRFFRVTPSYKGIYSGHGIGLHIAQSYVNLLGSEIKLESTEGKGTSFYFDLLVQIGCKENVKPLALPTHKLKKATPQPQALAVAEESAPEYVVMDPNCPNILLVEDNSIARNMAEAIAHKAGYQITSASNGEKAFELAKTEKFDLIITDVGLPGISGHQLAKLIREWEAVQGKKPIPILGLTAHLWDKTKAECLESGMNEVFCKPITLKLIQHIANRYQSFSTIVAQAPFEETLTDAVGKLGVDLPDSEAALFELDSFSIFDTQAAMASHNGDLRLLFQSLDNFLNKETPEDLLLLKAAHLNQNWEQIEQLAHKMKGGVIYLGMIRLRYACQYLERYRKAGHSINLDNLYHQLIAVTEETIQTVQAWLKKYRLN